jgi:2-methylcitrate dehydratase PrpD
MKLTREQTRDAFGIAEYHGPRSQMMRCIDFPTMVKDGSGWGALAGVSAAYLAAEGFTGAPALTAEAPGQRHLWADLGQRWTILEQYFKPYPVCRWAQPAVEAVRNLMRVHGLEGSDIAAVEIRTFAEGVRLATSAPLTTEAAQYSLPFPLAAMIVRGRIGADEITDDGLRDAAILDLSARVQLIEDPEICARFPAERFAVATLRIKDGRTIRSDWVEAPGGPANPLSDEEIAEKFRGLTAHMGEARSRAIETAIAGLGYGSAKKAAFLADLILQPTSAMTTNLTPRSQGPGSASRSTIL